MSNAWTCLHQASGFGVDILCLQETSRDERGAQTFKAAAWKQGWQAYYITGRQGQNAYTGGVMTLVSSEASNSLSQAPGCSPTILTTNPKSPL